MASLDWHCKRTGGVTLVELSVQSEFDQHVRIESRLTPVWPPRQQGVPEAGWRENCFEGTVEQGGRLVLGYATPAAPQEPPAEITATRRPPVDVPVTPREVVRALGEASPPRDALPAPHSSRETLESTQPATTHRRFKQRGHPVENRDTAPPVEPGEWFDAVESRLATAARLEATADADETRAVVDALGGIEAARALQARLEADRRALSEIQHRSKLLAEELSMADVPLATLERIV